MNTIKTKDGTEIFYKDWGTGQPIVFHHGWPLSGDDWDTQMHGMCTTHAERINADLLEFIKADQLELANA